MILDANWTHWAAAHLNNHISLTSLTMRCTIMLWITKHCQLTSARMHVSCTSDLDFRIMKIWNQVQLSSSVVIQRFTARASASRSAKDPQKLFQARLPPGPWWAQRSFPERSIRIFSPEFPEGGQISHQAGQRGQGQMLWQSTFRGNYHLGMVCTCFHSKILSFDKMRRITTCWFTWVHYHFYMAICPCWIS